MKIVVAIDSFKGSMTSMEAGYAISDGIMRVLPEADVSVRPLADGGEGTVDALVSGMNGVPVTVTVTGPLGTPVSAKYGIIRETKTAIIEMSAAAGITLVSDSERNPLNTTTYGVGELIRDAVLRGCRNFIIGIGGSATNDCGVGMLQALGFGMLDANGNQVEGGARGLEFIEQITDDNVMPQLLECSFHIACDVTNPLCGEEGCSAVYGPQKGADAAMVMKMDSWIEKFAALTKEKYPEADKEFPGTGAAGGLGYAFMAYLNGMLEPGIEIILRETELEEYIKDSELVITGEGRIDFQTSFGKAPAGVAALAKKYSIPVIAFAGSVTKDAVECNKHGIDAFFPILRGICTLEEAMNTQNAKENLTDTAEQVMRLWSIG